MANDFVYFFSFFLFVSGSLPLCLNNKSSGTDEFFAVFCLNARLQCVRTRVCFSTDTHVGALPFPHFTISTSCFFAHFPLNDSIWWLAFFLYRMYRAQNTDTHIPSILSYVRRSPGCEMKNGHQHISLKVCCNCHKIWWWHLNNGHLLYYCKQLLYQWISAWLESGARAVFLMHMSSYQFVHIYCIHFRIEQKSIPKKKMESDGRRHVHLSRNIPHVQVPINSYNMQWFHSTRTSIKW